MSLISSQYLTTAGTKQYGRGVEIQFSTVVSSNSSTNKLFFDNSNLYPQTLTNATTTVVSPGLSGEYGYNPTTYNPTTLDGVPVVDQARNGIRLTSTSANGNVAIPVTWNMTLDRFAILAIRSTGAAVAGKFKLESTASNDMTQNFTSNSTSGQQQLVLLDKLNPSSITGSIVLSSITKVTISLDLTTTSVELLGAYTVAEKSAIIGTRNDYRFECISSVDEERGQELSDQFCRQLLKDQIASKDGMKYKIKVKQLQLDLVAAGNGTTVSVSSVSSQTVLNSDTVQKVAIASNTISIGASRNICFVRVGDREFRTSPATTATNIVENEYHYNSSTGVMTFPAGYNGVIPTIVIWEVVSMSTIDIIALKKGMRGFLWMPNITEEGRTIITILDSARLFIGATSAADDGDETELNFTVLPNASGKLITMGAL